METGTFVEAVCTRDVDDDRDNEKRLGQRRNGRGANGTRCEATNTWNHFGTRRRDGRRHGERMFRGSEGERERKSEAARKGVGGEVAIYASDSGEPGSRVPERKRERAELGGCVY